MHYETGCLFPELKASYIKAPDEMVKSTMIVIISEMRTITS